MRPLLFEFDSSFQAWKLQNDKPFHNFSSLLAGNIMAGPPLHQTKTGLELTMMQISRTEIIFYDD